jgi:cytochrome c
MASAYTPTGKRSKIMTTIHLANQGQPGSSSGLAQLGVITLAAVFLLLQMIVTGAQSTEADKQSAASQGQPVSVDAKPQSVLPIDRSLIGHGGPVHAIQLNQTKTRALTGSFDYSMMLWDISGDKPKELHRFDDHDGWVKAVAFLPGDKRALAAGGGEIWLWDVESGKALHVFKGHKSEISTLALSSDGKWVASASSDRTARLWNLETLESGPVLKGHRGPINGIAFSSDDKIIYTASYDGTLRSWDSQSGEFKRILYRHGFGINAMRRLPGGDQIVFGALNGKALVIDGKTGEQVHQFKGILGPFLAIAIQEKPGLLALSGFQKKGGAVVGIIRVVRLGDWAPIEEYEDPRGPIWAMDFGSIGSTIYYGGKDDYVTVWQVTPRKSFETISGPIPRRYEVAKTAGPGELQFARKCSLCHTLSSDGGNRAGPTLYKVFGRKVGTLPGYPYSDALKNADIVWNEKTIGLLFGLGPNHYMPGTKMPIQRIADPKKRKALIAYLKEATQGKNTSGAPKGKSTNETEKQGSKEQ